MKSEIIDLQERTVIRIFNLAKSGQKSITVKAPTGSGKTHMMANLMDKMIADDESVIFIVSILSKGKLANQNYESFDDLSLNKYRKLIPTYISSGNENKKNTEYSLHIDDTCNVFVLPTSQYTENSRIFKERALINFLNNCKEKNKKIILVRDESHIATNKLDNLSNYFHQTINFSATPKDDKFDVVITEEDAISVNLIKNVEYIESDKDLKDDLDDALNKFLEIRKTYTNIGINPAFIIQISNKNKAEEEIEIIKKVVESKDLKWVYFAELDKVSGYATNSRLNKVKTKSLWQKYVKENNSFIDVVIFKMVITEGFDMPRACMLYQVRDSKSKQLDEQVIGRVRRNPCLTYFERLDKNVQEVFSKAYVYGIKPQSTKKKKQIRLRGNDFIASNEIVEKFRPFKITELKEVPVANIEISDCIDNSKIQHLNKSIFDLYKEFNKTNDKVKEKYYEYVNDYNEWYEFMANLNTIAEKVETVTEDYDSYGKLIERNNFREDNEAFIYSDGNISSDIDDWIWISDDDEYIFDSEAEKAFFKILKKLRKKCGGSVEIDGETIYLFGKNFIDNSNIRFDYFHNKVHTSYPDFIFKDKSDNVHIFEVKSVNKSSNNNIDDVFYKEKIDKLSKAYVYASKMTGYIFYLPIQTDEDWQIWKYEGGVASSDFMNETQFIEYMNKL